MTDYLYTFTGLPTERVMGWVKTALSARRGAEATLLHALTNNPLEANVTFLLGATTAFYRAEVGVNPGIKTWIDALYYISTCLSVGYADIFAVTQPGRAIAALVMMVGPALTAELLDPPERSHSASEVGQEKMIALLQELVTEVRNQR